MRTLVMTVVAALSLPGLACDTPPDPRRSNFEVRGDGGVAKYDPASGRLKKFDIDQNRNGRIETFSYWDGTRLLRIEVDRDEDGKVDRWEHYGAGNKMVRIGSSSRDDEIEDTWTYPDDNGLLRMVESDADRDGRIDRREFYAAQPGHAEGRVITIVEMDFDKSGQPARRLRYRADGSFDRAERLR